MSRLVMYSFILGTLLPSILGSAYVEGGVGTSEAGTRFEPQVAMVCGSRSQYHAQHMTESGRWVTDTASKTACLTSKVDILHYCKKMYPERDITNIVESTHYYKVPNFCRLGRTNGKCKASVWVKPYRCLEGSFQSDALLVPEGCLFDHIHNQSRCWEFDRWNTTADGACEARAMNLKSFAMLLPCGIDVFSGVEFVCCPKNYKAHGKMHTSEIEEPIALPQVDSLAAADHTNTPVHHDITTPSQEVGTRDEYFSRFDPHEEHDAFRRAEQRLEERHREKVSKIMKEWSELEERYEDLRSKDARGADEFKNRMTQRFQQTVEAVEAENEAERHQLTALHQQRIVAHINEMKREAMTCYTRALDAEQPNTHKVQKCLQKLLRALNKDRHHTVSHYKHLLNSDFEAADRERDSILQHLSDLDRMVNQSLNMLSRHSDLYGKIGRLMHEYAAALRSKDTTPPELTPQPPRRQLPDPEDESDEDDEDADYDEDDEDDDDEDDEDQVVDLDDDEDQEDHDVPKDQDKDHEQQLIKDDQSQVVQQQTINQQQAFVELRETPSEDLSNKNKDADSKTEITDNNNNVNEEHFSASPSVSDFAAEFVDSSSTPSTSPSSTPVVSHHVEEAHAAHFQHNSLNHERSGYTVTRDISGSDSRGVYFTLAFAGVALMAAMVVGIIVLRRRNSRHPHNQGFMEVDQAVTPEERHVTNMQVNGYENPTYKYFEEK